MSKSIKYVKVKAQNGEPQRKNGKGGRKPFSTKFKCDRGDWNYQIDLTTLLNGGRIDTLQPECLL